jgi:hypothetical protein
MGTARCIVQLNALLLPDDGWTAERVAEALFVDAESR